MHCDDRLVQDFVHALHCAETIYEHLAPPKAMRAQIYLCIAAVNGRAGVRHGRPGKAPIGPGLMTTDAMARHPCSLRDPKILSQATFDIFLIFMGLYRALHPPLRLLALVFPSGNLKGRLPAELRANHIESWPGTTRPSQHGLMRLPWTLQTRDKRHESRTWDCKYFCRFFSIIQARYWSPSTRSIAMDRVSRLAAHFSEAPSQASSWPTRFLSWAVIQGMKLNGGMAFSVSNADDERRFLSALRPRSVWPWPPPLPRPGPSLTWPCWAPRAASASPCLCFSSSE